MNDDEDVYRVVLRGTEEMRRDAYQRMTRALHRSKAGFTVALDSKVSPDHPDHPWKRAAREGRWDDAEWLLTEAKAVR